MGKRQDHREEILKRQGGKCLLCAYGQSHPDVKDVVAPTLTTKQMCYVPEQDVLVCRTCNTFLAVYKDRAKVGVDVAALELFLSKRGGE